MKRVKKNGFWYFYVGGRYYTRYNGILANSEIPLDNCDDMSIMEPNDDEFIRGLERHIPSKLQ